MQGLMTVLYGRYFAILPVAALRFEWDMTGTVSGALSWAFALGGWLYYAYLLEFLSVHSFFPLWLSSIAFFVVHIAILCMIIVSYPK